MRHSVNTKVLQDILNYLANRPYSEVATIIKALQDDATIIDTASQTEAEVTDIATKMA
jgi:hypothetical protein